MKNIFVFLDSCSLKGVFLYNQTSFAFIAAGFFLYNLSFYLKLEAKVSFGNNQIKTFFVKLKVAINFISFKHSGLNVMETTKKGFKIFSTVI